MSDPFDFFRNIKVSKKKHFVEIQGKKIEVSLEEKIDIIRNGEKNYILEDNRPVKIKNIIDRSKFAEIDNFKSNPFWPKEQFIWKK